MKTQDLIKSHISTDEHLASLTLSNAIYALESGKVRCCELLKKLGSGKGEFLRYELSLIHI